MPRAKSAIDPLIRLLSYVVLPGLSLEINVRRRGRAHSYNKDLILKLHNLERTGRIFIKRIEKNYIRPNPINPARAITWRHT